MGKKNKHRYISHNCGTSYAPLFEMIKTAKGGEELLRLLRFAPKLLDVANKDGAVGRMILRRWSSACRREEKRVWRKINYERKIKITKKKL